MPGIPEVDVPAEFTIFKYQLPNLARALKGTEPIRIVAMGSSSTAGRGDVVPYPYRLEMYLRGRYDQLGFLNLKIDVLNRGKGGEEAVEELKRFDADIFAERPSLVIWQVGTNAVFRKKEMHYDLDDVAAKITEGLERMRGKMDVVLINPQYTTAMLLGDKVDDSERMVALIAAAAKEASVNLFRRWELMRHWYEYNRIVPDQMIDTTDPDKLHQNDWSTLRVSLALCEAIATAPRAQT
jgi:hypothetical protein